MSPLAMYDSLIISFGSFVDAFLNPAKTYHVRRAALFKLFNGPRDLAHIPLLQVFRFVTMIVAPSIQASFAFRSWTVRLSP